MCVCVGLCETKGVINTFVSSRLRCGSWIFVNKGGVRASTFSLEVERKEDLLFLDISFRWRTSLNLK